MNQLDKEHLLEAIFGILVEKGIKDMTMNSIARDLHMSKRTLYEIFESKTGMILEVIDFKHLQFKKICEEIFNREPDMMSAMFKLYNIQRDFLCTANIKLFIDMDTLYPEIRSRYTDNRDYRTEEWDIVFRKGVEQGVFRPDVNLRVLTRLLQIQMEALKRMEDNFPSDLTLTDIYDTIWTSFLRTIASPKGMKLIENKDNKTTENASC